MKIKKHIRFNIPALLLSLLIFQACEEQPVNLMVPYNPPPVLVTVPPVAAPAEIIFGMDFTVKMDSVLAAQHLDWDNITHINTNHLTLNAVDGEQIISVPLDSIRIYLETDDTGRVLIGHRYQNLLDSTSLISISPDRNDLTQHLRSDTLQLILAAMIREDFTDTLVMRLDMEWHIRAEEQGE
ncbi:MAG: hypothetical protein WD077_13735 [Bacteroidia bacterium]